MEQKSQERGIDPDDTMDFLRGIEEIKHPPHSLEKILFLVYAETNFILSIGT